MINPGPVDFASYQSMERSRDWYRHRVGELERQMFDYKRELQLSEANLALERQINLVADQRRGQLRVIGKVGG